MVGLLRENPLLLLFLVAGIGYPLGRIKFGQASLGVSAVLFVGLAFGAIDPSLKIPETVQQLGLALFVYMIGLSSGPGFFRSFKGSGLRDNLFATGITILTGAMAFIPHLLLKWRPGLTTGIFAGVFNNTPAMAAVVESLRHNPAGAGQLTDPVVGFSIAYPVSVLVMILTIYAVQRLWRIDYQAEAACLRGMVGIADPLINVTVRVTRPEVIGRTIPELVQQHGWRVIFGRVRKGDQHSYVAGRQTRLEDHDLITAVGTPEELDAVAKVLGEISPQLADVDSSEVDMRQIFVSDPKVAGLRLRDLQLPQRFGAVVSRVRRGDTDLLPRADLVLELGDRVRVIVRRESEHAVARYFGDSYKAVSEIDITSLGFGLVVGIALGLVPIPFPGGMTIKLGLAGGPLLVALVLGTLARTGRFVWTLPYSANLLFRQFGLILFLAGVGTKSGYDLVHTLASASGLVMLVVSALLTAATGFFALWIGYRWLKIPMGMLTGIVAAIQTQPATLGFALDQTHNELPNVGYATTYPLSMIIKIVAAQVLLTLLL